MAPTLFLSAGEVSGDMHGARLARALLDRRDDLVLRGLGSHRMRDAGVEILADVTPHSAVGVTEHLPGVKAIAQAFKTAKETIAATRPDAVVLIDYQGANMQLAAHARALGIPTLYYIAPQEWIWGFKGGPRKVAAATDLILCVFEKEAEAYGAAGGNVQFIGHPLLDMVPPSTERAAFAQRVGVDLGEPIVALFPGSRRMEIDRLLAPMLDAARRIRAEVPTVQFLLPVATPDLRDRVRRLAEGIQGVRIVEDAPGMAIQQLADVVLAASGTVILESAVVGTPVVAAYRLSPLAAVVARLLLKIPYVTLPNIVLDQPVVPELLQGEANGTRMAQEVLSLMQDARRRTQMIAQLGQVRAKLGSPGAVGRAADAILAHVGAPLPAKV